MLLGGSGGSSGGGFDTHNNNNNNTFTYTFHGDPKATFAEFFGTSNPFETFFNLGGKTLLFKFLIHARYFNTWLTALTYRNLISFHILGSPSHHNLFGGVNDDPHDPMDTNDPFGFSSLGGGLGLSGFGPQVRPGNTPFRSHSFNIGGHRAGGGQKVIFFNTFFCVHIS